MLLIHYYYFNSYYIIYNVIEPITYTHPHLLRMGKRWLTTIMSVLLISTFYIYWKLEQLSVKEDGLEQLRENEKDYIASKRMDDEEGIFHKRGSVQDPRLKFGSEYFCVVLVHSAINQTGRRESIRETWLSDRMVAGTGVTLAYWFILGTSGTHKAVLADLQREQSLHGDLMIFFNLDNGYEGLPDRTLYSMTHISKHYHFTFLLKTDDDVYINLPIVLQEMKKIRPRERLYWGRFSCQNPPMEEGRWKEELWHWCDVYFPYAYGGMYVLTSDVVSLIADNAPELQKYSCEDVSLGMWLAPYNLVRINDIRIFIQHSTRCSRGFIAVHIPDRQVNKIIHKLHENLKKNGILCATVAYEDLLSWRGLPKECNTDSLVVV